jgi:hypothetical protein
MIRDARTDRTLLCVSKDDLLAPYRTKERRRHEELCELLQTACTFDIRFEDFLTTFDEEGASTPSRPDQVLSPAHQFRHVATRQVSRCHHLPETRFRNLQCSDSADAT